MLDYEIARDPKVKQEIEKLKEEYPFIRDWPDSNFQYAYSIAEVRLILEISNSYTELKLWTPHNLMQLSRWSKHRKNVFFGFPHIKREAIGQWPTAELRCLGQCNLILLALIGRLP